MVSRTNQGGKWCLWTLLVLLLGCMQAAAQTVSGTITGTVIDNSGGVIPGANITLTNGATGASRTAESNAAGEFVFSSVPRGIYTIKVEKSGFKTFESKENVLTATQRLALGNIQLTLGELTETVNVTAQGLTVNTENAENSSLLSSGQLDTTTARGRDVINLIKILPGVSQITSAPWGELSESDPGLGTGSVGGEFGTFSPNVAGTRSYWNNMTLDGQPADTTGIRSLFDETLSMDSVAEVKVSQNMYAAEYGRNPGANINIISKSGTQDFHGSLYWYKRNESLDATNFFNNKYALGKPIYRYSTPGGSIGGPIYIPHKFNTSKDKLFFFFAMEHWSIRQPGGVRYLTTPTSLERQGDFSQTLDQGGQLIPIIDPLTKQQFPGNIIPQNRISPNGQALLNVLPVPNQLDRNVTFGAYNYQWEDIPTQKKVMQLLRFDYHPTVKDLVTLRLRRWNSDFLAYTGGNVGFNDLPLAHVGYFFSLDSALLGWTRTFRPNLVNEVNAGFREEKEYASDITSTTFDQVLRSTTGFNLGQLFPSANPTGFVPQALFGGVPSAGNITYDSRLPLNASMAYVHFLDNLSYIRGTHTFKFGVYAERVWNTYGYRSTGSPSGTFDFSRDPNNPGDTSWPYSTALLGNFRAYSESSNRTRGRETIMSVEWFAQDTWKVSRKLTLTYGVRFSWARPWEPNQTDKEGASIALSRYNAANAPLFYNPALDPSGKRVAQDPVTGAFYPATLIGAFVPGTGDPTNGIVVTGDPGYPKGFVDTPPVQVAPRVGFAYDPFGDGKTAIRGGFGSAKETQPSVNPVFWTSATNTPLINTPQIFYGNMSTLLGTQGSLFPSSATSIALSQEVPTVFSYSLGIQRQLPWSTLLDVSYVGNHGVHLYQKRDFNTVPYGARFQPQNQDPTTGAALPDDFFRPYPGYTGGLTYLETAGISNYNSLQVAVNRRFTHGVQFGIAYTWSKTMDFSDSEEGIVALYQPVRVWNYGKAGFDQSQMFVFNYDWALPKASKLLPNPVVRAVFDNWKISGITTFATGLPNGINLSTTDNADITGGGDGVRVLVVQPPELGHGERSGDRWFNTSAFGRPPTGNAGDAPKDVFRGPGLNNWDIAIMKNFPLWRESRFIQLRWDMYNAFNHTQFMSVDNNARFDPDGNQVNGQFGQAVAARPPRIMQITLRFQF